MPDLDIVAFWCCASVLADEIEVPSSNGGTYKVRWEPAPPQHPYSMWWHCPCPSFTFRGTCRHVKEAEQKHCGWDTGPGIGDTGVPVITNREPLIQVCPRCGGPVTAQRWGV
jgi:hypothetical protein